MQFLHALMQRFAPPKCDMDTVDWCAYYTFCCDTGSYIFMMSLCVCVCLLLFVISSLSSMQTLISCWYFHNSTFKLNHYPWAYNFLFVLQQTMAFRISGLSWMHQSWTFLKIIHFNRQDIKNTKSCCAVVSPAVSRIYISERRKD